MPAIASSYLKPIQANTTISSAPPSSPASGIGANAGSMLSGVLGGRHRQLPKVSPGTMIGNTPHYPAPEAPPAQFDTSKGVAGALGSMENIGSPAPTGIGAHNGSLSNLIAQFKKFHGSAYDPNSRMDRAKLQHMQEAQDQGGSLVQAANDPVNYKVGFVKAAMRNGFTEKQAISLADTLLKHYDENPALALSGQVGARLGSAGALTGGIAGAGLGGLLGYGAGKLSDDPTAAKRRAGYGAVAGGLLGELSGAAGGGMAAGLGGDTFALGDIRQYLDNLNLRDVLSNR